MIEFRGVYFDGLTARPHPARAVATGAELRLWDEAGSLLAEARLDACTVTPPLGTTRRCLTLPGGSRLETDDRGSIEALEEQLGSNRGLRLVHRLESRWRSAAAGVAALAALLGAAAVYGIPWAARAVAFSAPLPVLEALTHQSEEVLSSRFLEGSRLGPRRQAQVRSWFDRVRRDLGGPYPYRLEFRRGKTLGPNAFALPSGLVLVTDELLALSWSEADLAGVFAHELAHVEARHGLRSVLQNSGVVLIAAALLGDVSSINSAGAALPTLLVEATYSRRFEGEADRSAGNYLVRRGFGTKPFRELLARLAAGSPEIPGAGVLSTHPRTRERVEFLRELERHPGRPTSGPPIGFDSVPGERVRKRNVLPLRDP